MKKALFLFVLVGISCIAYAQQRTVYCEMIGSGNFTGKSIKISFDFGDQGFYYKASDDNQIINEKGKIVPFSSMIAALNYMSERGWELQTAYSASIKGQGGAETYRYILTKKIGPNENIMDGIRLLGEYKQKKKAERTRDDIYR